MELEVILQTTASLFMTLHGLLYVPVANATAQIHRHVSAQTVLAHFVSFVYKLTDESRCIKSMSLSPLAVVSR